MKSIINGKMVKWARERAGLSIDELADKLSTTSENVQAWENDKKSIPMGKAETLAGHALIPFGILFADKPPEIKLPIPDLRSKNNLYVQNPSPNMLEVILDAQEKQDWYREYLIESGSEPLEYVGSITTAMNPTKVAEIIRQILGLPEDNSWREGDSESVLRNLIDKTENAGILVLRSGVVKHNNNRRLNVEEFRGFVLSDDVAPLIFINGADAKSAQMFTLVHEIGHVLLDESAISDFSAFDKDAFEIEKFCNQVAAEFLIPSKEFVRNWNESKSIGENLNDLVSHFKVSKLVAISRAFQLRFVDWDTLEKLRIKELKRLAVIKDTQKRQSGGNFYATLKYKVSPKLAAAVISEVKSGRMHYRDAFNLLLVKKMSTFNELVGRLEMV